MHTHPCWSEPAFTWHLRSTAAGFASMRYRDQFMSGYAFSFRSILVSVLYLCIVTLQNDCWLGSQSYLNNFIYMALTKASALVWLLRLHNYLWQLSWKKTSIICITYEQRESVSICQNMFSANIFSRNNCIILLLMLFIFIFTEKG